MRAEATKKKGQKETWTDSERYKKIERRRERERESLRVVIPFPVDPLLS